LKEVKQAKNVPEVVWIPTYVAVTLLVLGKVDSSGLWLFPLLLASRLTAELIYRIVFGDERHNASCQRSAFLVQVIMWAAVTIVALH
jgi:hypothetical protein